MTFVIIGMILLFLIGLWSIGVGVIGIVGTKLLGCQLKITEYIFYICMLIIGLYCWYIVFSNIHISL